MCNVRVVLTLFSIVLIALFITFCYLISIVDPPPTKLEEEVDYSEASPSELPLAESNQEKDNILPPDRRNLILDKLGATGELEASSAKSLGGSSSKLKTRQVRPPLISPLNEEHHLNYDGDLKKNTNMKDKPTTERANLSGIKGHRRSVQNFEQLFGDDSQFVIINIVDDSGQPRIEVKLNSVKSMELKRQKNKTGFRMDVQRNNRKVPFVNQLPKNSVISLMPNNTLVIDEFHKTNSFGYNFPKERSNICKTTNAVKEEVGVNNNPAVKNKTVTKNIALNKNTSNVSGENDSDTERNVNYTNINKNPKIIL